MVMPGDNVNAAFELISPLPLQQGIFQLTSSSLKEKCISQLLTVLPIFMHLLSEIICSSSLYFYNEIYILVQGICDHLYASMHHTHCKIHKHRIWQQPSSASINNVFMQLSWNFLSSSNFVYNYSYYNIVFYWQTGQRFALREGGRTVGAGVVSKVISWFDMVLESFFITCVWLVANLGRNIRLNAASWKPRCHVMWEVWISFYFPGIVQKVVSYLKIERN